MLDSKSDIGRETNNGSRFRLSARRGPEPRKPRRGLFSYVPGTAINGPAGQWRGTATLRRPNICRTAPPRPRAHNSPIIGNSVRKRGAKKHAARQGWPGRTPHTILYHIRARQPKPRDNEKRILILTKPRSNENSRRSRRVYRTSSRAAVKPHTSHQHRHTRAGGRALTPSHAQNQTRPLSHAHTRAPARVVVPVLSGTSGALPPTLAKFTTTDVHLARHGRRGGGPCSRAARSGPTRDA